MVCKRPHLRIIEPGLYTSEELSNDALTMRGFEEYRINDYHLGWCCVEAHCFSILKDRRFTLFSLGWSLFSLLPSNFIHYSALSPLNVWLYAAWSWTHSIFSPWNLYLFLFLSAECIPDENIFFIISPKDVVISRLRDMDDHITWLMDHERYEVLFCFKNGSPTSNSNTPRASVPQYYLAFMCHWIRQCYAMCNCLKIWLQKLLFSALAFMFFESDFSHQKFSFPFFFSPELYPQGVVKCTQLCISDLPVSGYFK